MTVKENLSSRQVSSHWRSDRTLTNSDHNTMWETLLSSGIWLDLELTFSMSFFSMWFWVSGDGELTTPVKVLCLLGRAAHGCTPLHVSYILADWRRIWLDDLQPFSFRKMWERVKLTVRLSVSWPRGAVIHITERGTILHICVPLRLNHRSQSVSPPPHTCTHSLFIIIRAQEIIDIHRVH